MRLVDRGTKYAAERRVESHTNSIIGNLREKRKNKISKRTERE